MLDNQSVSANCAGGQCIARRVGERFYDPSKTDVSEAVYVWMFPNVMLNVYMGQMQTNTVIPLSHDRTRVTFDWYATKIVKLPADTSLTFGKAKPPEPE